MITSPFGFAREMARAEFTAFPRWCAVRRRMPSGRPTGARH